MTELMTPVSLEQARRTGLDAHRTGRFDIAVSAFGAVVRAADAARTPDLAALTNLAISLLGLGRLDEARLHLERLLGLGRERDDAHVVAVARSGLGHVQRAAGAHDEAVEHFLAAIATFENGADAAELGQALADLGDTHYTAGRFDDAVTVWATAAEQLRAVSAAESLSRLLINVGGVLHYLRRHDEALAALDEAAERLPAPVARAYLPSLELNRAVVRLELGRLDDAIASLELACTGFAALGDYPNEARQTAALADLQRIAGRLDKAVACHQRAMALETEHGLQNVDENAIVFMHLQDRSLWVDGGSQDAESHDRRRRRAAEGNLDEALVAPHAPAAELAERPFVVFAPPCPGVFGPAFPRGATAIASFLNAHGLPALVVPLSYYVDVTAPDGAREARLREVVAEVVRDLQPRAIGISVTFSYLYPQGLDIARAVAAVDPDLTVIIGGPHVTYWDKECLEEAPEIDVVVRGEGEWTAVELLRALESGGDLGQVLGITWRDREGQVHRNRLRPLGNVLELPPIDFGLLPPKFATGMEVFGLSSRGCTFRCRYCHEFRYWGGVVRQYPVERLVAELERLYRDHGNPMRGIDDSMLNMLEPYFIELIDALGRSPYLPDPFGLLTRVDTISAEGLAAMERARIGSLSVGMESGSPKVLEAMNKDVTIEQAMVGLELVRASDVSLSTFFIVGHPGDNPIESERTIAFIDGLFRDGYTDWVDLSIFTPYPGTPFFMVPEKYGVRILTTNWRRWTRSNRPISELTDFSANEIYLAYLKTLEVKARYTT